jgi:hypothetical protein
LAILVYYLKKGDSTLAALASVTGLGTALIPYVKARAEPIHVSCNTGLMERPERVILPCAGLLFGWMAPVLWIMAILTHFTVLQRIHYVWKKLRLR